MSEPNPPRRPLATFLRAAPAHEAAHDVVSEPADDALDAAAAQGTDVPSGVPATAIDNAMAPAASTTATTFGGDVAIAAGEQDIDDPPPAPPRIAAAPAIDGPSFLGVRPRALPTPRWHWLLVAGLALLLVLLSVLADRARLAADAGSRPWVSALCSVVRCSLPAWREPTALTMTSREIRPLPGQPGVLQIQASIRNDARWAQAWPDLRLSLSDADGRVIGTGVFAPAQYLGGTPDAALLEPGQSARIAFRVQEPAASTVAFTFEFL